MQQEIRKPLSNCVFNISLPNKRAGQCCYGAQAAEIEILGTRRGGFSVRWQRIADIRPRQGAGLTCLTLQHHLCDSFNPS
jgi:hypothetical protein